MRGLALLVAAAAIMAAPAASAAIEPRCYAEAAQRYRTSAALLRAIAIVESGEEAGKVGSLAVWGEDLCAMQVHSQHLKRLTEWGITRERLLTEPCTCVAIGAWILSGEVAAVGAGWRAVARYHTGPRFDTDPQVRRRGIAYAWKVHRALAVLQGKGDPER